MCTTGHSNLCDLGAATFAPGQISDGTVRYHFEGRDLNVMAKVGTFAEHGVVREASLVKVYPDLPLNVVALVSCGATTGGPAVYRAEVKPGETVVVVGVRRRRRPKVNRSVVQRRARSGRAGGAVAFPIPNAPTKIQVSCSTASFILHCT
jgi:Zn-dependent alcohol dehydrogenase